MEELLFEIMKAIGKTFLNPILYWIVFISLMLSYKRVKDERNQFSKELFPLGAEFKRTIHVTILGSLSISVIMLLFNTFFVSEIILFLSIIIFILSFTSGFKFLSAAYSLGLTFVIFKILEAYNNRLFDSGLISNYTFSSIALLTALFLLIEAYLYTKITNETAFPEIVKSKRGSWIGIYHIQKASIVPFFVFMPGELTIHSINIIPYVTIGNENLNFAFIPFITGFHHMISGHLPETICKNLQRNNVLLGLIVLIFSLVSFYLQGLAFVAIVVAMIGKLYIDYLIIKQDRERGLSFLYLKEQLKVFAIVPNSPASKLGLSVGDTITKVNGTPIETIDELSNFLETTIQFPSFEIITSNREVRQIENDKFRGNHKELGIIFALKDSK